MFENNFIYSTTKQPKNKIFSQRRKGKNFLSWGRKFLPVRAVVGLPPFSAAPAGAAACAGRLFFKIFLAKIQLVGLGVLFKMGSDFFQ